MTLEDDTLGYLAATIHSRAEVLVRPSPVPQEPGVYGWWFRELPAEIDIRGLYLPQWSDIALRRHQPQRTAEERTRPKQRGASVPNSDPLHRQRRGIDAPP